MKRKCNVGGQAVIEGVMMRGEKGIATAVRKPNGEITIDLKKQTPLNKRNKFFSLPIIRGFLALIDSLVIGIKTLNFSASFFEDDEEPSKTYEFMNKIFKGKADDIIMGITTILSCVLSVGLFIIVPTIIAQFFKRMGISSIGLNFIEGIIRVILFLMYIVLISKLDDIYRLFQYHGAEHKTIFCYEDGLELTVENVKKFGRLHPRCGTNFMFLVVLVSIVLFSFTGWGSVTERIISRLLLLPVVSGLTFEIIKWLGASDSAIGKVVAYPGLKLQLLTTKEPDDKQIEVAIASLKSAEGVPIEKTIGELLNESNEKLKGVSETYILDGQLMMEKIIGKDRIYIMTNRSEKLTLDQEAEFRELLQKREDNMPMKYILGHTEFMGIDFYVEKGVLIPRNDTEILVEEAINIIKSIESDKIKICDLCCGSGAIGLSLAKILDKVKVDLIDIEEIPKKVTEINIEKLELKEKCTFIHSDLLEKVIKENRMYQVLVSNPPYIKADYIDELMKDVKDYEPKTALDGGIDGLDFYREIAKEALNVLEENGYIIFEIGHDQGEDVKAILNQNGYVNVRIVQDLAGKDRVVLGVKVSSVD
ncbi:MULTISPECIES: peptide chain release factor N(5)-glutamine methyltransferase [Clostridium]|uniref:Release factor glutamine methyltransferase n=1 Tax=Clostridium cadaveris TaxID=1529 RepID=A0A1I2LKS6_9CLOT|nr:peptide chain release factor N(5)-glutamine methyltransferase [Clostridium cadaveris]MDM8310652.1 peptide chain release factor N(5)-glutamine methyltransferase [Clostridium cadaveris]MDU4951382.1 peptide chain release factor N(5)-glutamine methyltransferase [Clostridium sp.]UFH64307.1 peptide chain release factor N(5)-glutamine methyltransferase [Clostridium cadaveris]SFF78037.1 protein-(glutamine-N5) methyltransferase, release factor-specific [Clostridium cadaveris]